MGREKRLSPRVPLQSPVRYRIISQDAAGYQEAAFQDVSQTGFRFRSKEFIPKQASIILEMKLLGYAPLCSLAKAVWIRQMPSISGYEVGGLFVELPKCARSTLDQLISGVEP